MLVLVVTSTGPGQKPAIVFKHPNDVANLHFVRIGAPPLEVNPREAQVVGSFEKSNPLSLSPYSSVPNKSKSLWHCIPHGIPGITLVLWLVMSISTFGTFFFKVLFEELVDVATCPTRRSAW